MKDYEFVGLYGIEEHTSVMPQMLAETCGDHVPMPQDPPKKGVDEAVLMAQRAGVKAP